MASYYNKNFRVKQTISTKLILSCIACVIGLLSLFFLFAPGVIVTNSITSKQTYLSLGELTFGGLTPISAGLVTAFFLAIGASLIGLGTSGFHYVGYLAGLLFLTSAICFFCVIPMVGDGFKNVTVNGIKTLGFGTYAVGISQIICAILMFVAAKGE